MHQTVMAACTATINHCSQGVQSVQRRELLAVGKMKLGPTPSSQGRANFRLAEINVARMVSPKPGDAVKIAA